MSLSDVSWYLVSDEDREIVAERNDILDVLKIREHTDADTRITDTEPDNYDRRNRPDDSGNQGILQSL